MCTHAPSPLKTQGVFITQPRSETGITGGGGGQNAPNAREGEGTRPESCPSKTWTLDPKLAIFYRISVERGQFWKQEKGVLAKGVSADSSVTAKETKNTQRYWPQQYLWRSVRHSQERRTFLQQPPSKNPLSLVPDQFQGPLEIQNFPPSEIWPPLIPVSNYRSIQNYYPRIFIFSELIRRGVIYYAGSFLPQIIFVELIMWGNSVSHYVDWPVFWGVKITPKIQI